jgi:hypothetical protein
MNESDENDLLKIIKNDLTRVRNKTDNIRAGYRNIGAYRQHGMFPEKDYSQESIFICKCGKSFSSEEEFIKHIKNKKNQ